MAVVQRPTGQDSGFGGQHEDRPTVGFAGWGLRGGSLRPRLGPWPLWGEGSPWTHGALWWPQVGGTPLGTILLGRGCCEGGLGWVVPPSTHHLQGLPLRGLCPPSLQAPPSLQEMPQSSIQPKKQGLVTSWLHTGAQPYFLFLEGRRLKGR